MNALKRIAVALAATVVLATGALELAATVSAAPAAETVMPATAAEHASEAAKYEQEAAELDRKAQHHAQMAKGYRARYSAGSKQADMLLSLVNHCERLAQHYAAAAEEARAMAKSLQKMSQAM